MEKGTEKKKETEKKKDGQTLNPDGALRRGYLIEDFRVFHIDSVEKEPIPPHFHGFHKLILVLGGNLQYVIEGVSCHVLQGEVLLVPAFSIHQPLIGPESYERIVLWVSPEARELEGLSETFRMAQEDRSYVLRTEKTVQLFKELSEIEKERGRGEEAEYYGSTALRSAYLTELTALCGRELLRMRREREKKQTASFGRQTALSAPDGVVRDPLVLQVISYIEAHPEEELSAKALAEQFFVSESGLCVRFGKTTGLSLHQYVLQKRLIDAAKKMRSGIPAVMAASQAGFSDYSTFYRAFKRYFEVSPRQFTASS